MIRAADVLRAATARLAGAGIADAARDARRLLSHALGVATDRLTLVLNDPVTDAVQAGFAAMIDARLARQPVAQITGQRLFWGRSFRVTRDTLDPRPDTETLIAAALDTPFGRVLDLGTGTGCILLTLLAERGAATGLGTDVSPTALDVARDNARALGLDGRAAFCRSDWFAGVAGAFDLIVANPPYIAADEMAALAPEVRDWEPHLALTPGGDGLAAYRGIAAGLGAHLAPGGRVLVEIGPAQAAAVMALFHDAGLRGITCHRDMDGRDRCIEGHL